MARRVVSVFAGQGNGMAMTGFGASFAGRASVILHWCLHSLNASCFDIFGTALWQTPRIVGFVLGHHCLCVVSNCSNWQWRIVRTQVSLHKLA